MSGTIETGARAGIASITINGSAYDVVSDLSYNCNTVKRDTLIGQSGVQGYKVMPFAPYIGATLRDNGDLTVANFNGMTNVSVVVQLANGKTVQGDGMWNTEADEVKTEEGTFAVKFEGGQVFEDTV